MKYKHVEQLAAANFRRRTGIHKQTFQEMVACVRIHELGRKRLSGRPQKLSYEDQVLMLLEYLREYRTYFHIAHEYGVSEANAYKIIKKVEDILVNEGDFTLPERTRVLSDNTIEVVLVDVSESPIERPKKSKNGTIPERKSVIRSKRN